MQIEERKEVKKEGLTIIDPKITPIELKPILQWLHELQIQINRLERHVNGLQYYPRRKR